MALNALAIDVMLPALPYMGEALGVVQRERAAARRRRAYMIGFGLAQLVFGPLTDRFGRRAPLFVGIGIYVVCAFAATFAPTFAILLGAALRSGPRRRRDARHRHLRGARPASPAARWPR